MQGAIGKEEIQQVFTIWPNYVFTADIHNDT